MGGSTIHRYGGRDTNEETRVESTPERDVPRCALLSPETARGDRSMDPIASRARRPICQYFHGTATASTSESRIPAVSRQYRMA